MSTMSTTTPSSPKLDALAKAAAISAAKSVSFGGEMISDDASSSRSSSSSSGSRKGGPTAAVVSDSSSVSTAATLSSGRGKLQFPWKLHQVLDRADRGGYADVIRWSPNGTSFVITSKRRFEDQVMPTTFSSNKFKSFQRSLNLWGFRVIPAGSEKGNSYHPCFVRGRPNLCFQMERTKVKVPGKRREAAEARRAKEDLKTKAPLGTSTTAKKPKSNNGPRMIARSDPNTTREILQMSLQQQQHQQHQPTRFGSTAAVADVAAPAPSALLERLRLLASASSPSGNRSTTAAVPATTSSANGQLLENLLHATLLQRIQQGQAAQLLFRQQQQQQQQQQLQHSPDAFFYTQLLMNARRNNHTSGSMSSNPHQQE